MDDSERGDVLGDLRRATDRAIDNLTKKLEGSSRPGSGDSKTSTRQLRELAERQNQILERVMESAAFIGHVVSINGDQKEKGSTLTVSCYGRMIEVKPVPGLELKPGDCVKLAPNSSQIIGLSADLGVGSICLIKNVIDDNFSEVDLNGSIRRIANGSFSKKIESDDRVILDSSGSIIIARLEKAKTRFKLGSKPTVTWDDICGQEDAKRQLKEMIEIPYKCPKLYQYYNLSQPKGALLFGPPGCGKTMLLEAIATSMSEMHGSEALESGFITIKGPEVLDMYVGLAEKAIRQIFEMARRHKAKYNYPAVIVIDEAEALLSKRGSGKNSDMEKTIVPTFLTEMQGIDDSSAIVFLCTNRPDVLDPAVIRDERLDRQIKVSRPDKKAAQAIFLKNIARYPLSGSAEEFSSYAVDEFYSDSRPIYEISLRTDKQMKFKLGDLVNGAMLVGIVKKAVLSAFQRDYAMGGEEDPSRRTSIIKEDLVKAVEETYTSKFDLPHQDELKEFVADFKDEVVGIEKVRLVQAQKG